MREAPVLRQLSFRQPHEAEGPESLPRAQIICPQEPNLGKS